MYTIFVQLVGSLGTVSLLICAVMHFTAYRRVWGFGAALRDLFRPGVILCLRSRLRTIQPPPADRDMLLLRLESQFYRLFVVAFSAVTAGLILTAFGKDSGRSFSKDCWAMPIEIRANGRLLGANEERLLKSVEVMVLDGEMLPEHVARRFGTGRDPANSAVAAAWIAHSLRLTSKGEPGVFYIQPIGRRSDADAVLTRDVASNMVAVLARGMTCQCLAERSDSSVECVVTCRVERAKN